jgi:hypothetical protein
MHCNSTKAYSYSVALPLLALAIILLPSVSEARQLDVGPGRQFEVPSAAASASRPGDTIVIQPGEYFDCAVWTVNRLTIAGAAPGVTITDKTCEGKALFVMRGNDITVRNITLTRARVPDSNGAGIRAEGRNLTVENSRFLNNENGILAADDPASTITVSNSEFRENGKCAQACAHGIYVGRIGLLRISGSTFDKTKVGHSIKSRALRTELRNNVIVDGADGTSSYVVDIPNGGSLVMEGNTLEKGPKSSNPSAAVVIGAEGVTHPTRELRIAANNFTNDQPQETVFVRNLTATPAILTGNSFVGKVKPLSGEGSAN